METTLFSLINVETPVIVAEDGSDTITELAILDDAKLRLIGGGTAMVVQF